MATKIRGLQIVDSIAGAALDLTSSGILNVLVDGTTVSTDGNQLSVIASGVDHNSLLNTHNLTTDIDHDQLTNTHNLSTDIDHDGLTNTHNLTTDIDHGGISGLSDDDHTQYILVDGTRDFTGIFGAVGMELTEGDVKLYSAPAAGDVSGITASGTTAATFGQVVYVDGSGNYVAAKADASATMPAAALVTAVSNEVMTAGYVTVSGWGWTPGGLLYVSDATAGDMTQTAPTASGSQVQIVGVAISATTIYFNPDATTVELGDSPFYTKAEVDTLISGSTASGVIDHGTLAGLADDDHPQYVPINGSRQMTADWNIGSYNLGFDVVSPTYPIDIEKTWGVSNAYPSELLIYPTMTGSLTGDIFYTGISVATNSAGWVENGNNASYEGIWINMAPLTDSYSVKGGTFDATNSNAVVMDIGTAVTANVYNLDASGTLTLGSAVDAYIQNAGSAGTTYLYQGTYNGAGSWTDKWGIHLTGDVKNYLSGTLQLNIPAASSGTGLVLVNDGSIIKSRTIGEIGDEIASSTEHNSLNAIQGGVTTERYHLANAQQRELSDGFLPDVSSTTDLLFDVPTRTVTITGTSGAFKYYVKSVEYSSTSDSIVVASGNGIQYVYYDANGDIATSGSPWDLSAVVPIAYVIYNTTLASGVLADERHQIVMDWQTHEYLHLTVNTRYGSGFGISGYTPLLDTDAAVQFGLGAGVLYDEDLVINVTDGTGSADFEQPLTDPAQIPVFYREAPSGPWIWDTATDFAFKNTSSGRVNYNNPTGWAQTQCTDTYYVAYFIVGTNNIDFPIISIQGQREDSSLANAMANTSFANLQLGSMPFAEMKPLYRIILRSATAYGGTRKAMIAEVTDLRNAGSLPATAFVATDHGSLSGLSDDDHIQYLLADGSRALSGDLLPNASGTVDLGSAALPYAEIYVDDIYVKGASIHLGGYEISEFSNDDTLADASTAALPTEYAVKNYATTLSGDIMQHVEDDFISNSEMTTISGDIINYVDAEVVWEVVDTPTNRIQPKAAHMGLPIYTSGSMTVGGDLTVTGTTFYTETEEVLVSDNFLYINYGEPGSGVTSVTAGIDIDRGGMPSYVFAFDERNDTFRIGVSGTQDAFNDYPLQPVATREDVPLDTRVPWWDAASYTFRTQGGSYISVTSGTGQVLMYAGSTLAGYAGGLELLLFTDSSQRIGKSGGETSITLDQSADSITASVQGVGSVLTMSSGGTYRFGKYSQFEINNPAGTMTFTPATGAGHQLTISGTAGIKLYNSTAYVNEILNTVDADSISTSSTDAQLATAKLIYDYTNTVSGAVLHNNRPDLQGGLAGAYYHLGATAFTALSGVDGTDVSNWDTAYSHTLSTSNPHSVTYSQVGAIQDAADTVFDSHINWGSAANQVDLDDVPDGTSYERVAASQLNSGIYIDASTSIKGIASFSSDNFAVTSGVVTVKDDGIAEAELVISNAPIDGYYLQYTTASGMKWTDVSTEGVLESDLQLDNMSSFCNGVETTFYLSYVPVANSLQVYLNGLLQEKGGGKDYTNTTSGVLFSTAPLTGDILIAHYVRTSA